MSISSLQKNTISFGLILTALIGSYQYFHGVQVRYLAVTSFKECVDAGFHVLVTYPEKCVMSGKVFINPDQKKQKEKVTASSTTKLQSYEDLTYYLNGESIAFNHGIAILPANITLHRATTTLRILDKRLLQDINNDIREDDVFLLESDKNIQSSSSYFITAALRLYDGYTGTNSIYVDNNINDFAFVYKNGEIVLGYTTKNATTTLREKYFVFEDGLLQQVFHK